MSAVLLLPAAPINPYYWHPVCAVLLRVCCDAWCVCLHAVSIIKSLQLCVLAMLVECEQAQSFA
jgi:hypothetical protein